MTGRATHRRTGVWERPTTGSTVERARAGLGGVKTAVRQALHPAVHASHVEWSLLSSVVDLEPKPSGELVRVALTAASRALETDLSELAQRAATADAQHINLWPGEHYRLLVGLVETLDPRMIVEVGTFRGLGALALKQKAAEGARVVTYDVEPYTSFQHPALRNEDFQDGLQQRLGDLSDPSYFSTQLDIMGDADLMFIDGPKDGRFERQFLNLLTEAGKPGALLVFDDIRLMNMVGFWRDLPLPKLDVTSLGHYTGTGIARLC
jgi:predicted O-methyltransferase YrrM